MGEARVSLDDVRRAREVLRPYLKPTPLRASSVLGAGAQLKLECWQPTGSFKVRGATALLASLTPAEQARGVVAASAGNHALGVAFAASVLGGRVRATLFVPETAPRAKVEKLRSFDVEVREIGRTYDDAFEASLDHARRTGAIYVHAYDDAHTVAGQGTAGLEILDDQPDVGTVVVPVGGGGLITGVAVVVKALRPDARIVAVQPEASPSLRESIRQGRALTTYAAGETLSDGLAGGIGEFVFAHRDLLDDVVTVSEEETAEAIVALLARDQILAEASGAVGVAAVRSGRVRDPRGIAVVVTGANIDVGVLERLLRARVPGGGAPEGEARRLR